VCGGWRERGEMGMECIVCRGVEREILLVFWGVAMRKRGFVRLFKGILYKGVVVMRKGGDYKFFGGDFSNKINIIDFLNKYMISVIIYFWIIKC